MQRRQFISLFGGIAAGLTWPLSSSAQKPNIRRIGVLVVGNADADAVTFQTELREELRKSGYVEGQNLIFELRSAEQKIDLLPKLAAELVAKKVDVIVALYTPCALAAKQATREIPIVAVSGDPVGTGLVPSLARPGANLTGVSLITAEMHGKCAELFRDMLPSIRRVAALGNAADPFSKPFLEQVQLAGKTTNIEIAPITMVAWTSGNRSRIRTHQARSGGRSCRAGQSSVEECGGSSGTAQSASGLSSPIFCRSWWLVVLWRRQFHFVSTKCKVCHQDIARWVARGDAN